jgi:carbonic anhydrase/acetyltransferase-like protein (isoleucine patch superfamily)
VLIGPHPHVNGATVQVEVFVATGASLFPGAVAGAGSELRIDSVLHINSRPAPGTAVPIR